MAGPCSWRTGLVVALCSVMGTLLLLGRVSSSPAGMDSIKYVEQQENCVHNNVTYKAGERFRPDPCSYCHCPRHGGRAQCAVQDCLWEPSCVRYHRGPGECCGACVQYGCRHSDGRIYKPGTVITENECERCVCPPGGGRSQCSAVQCPRVACVDAVKDPGDCCYRCPNGPNCWLEDRVIAAGSVVQPDACSRCRCPDVPTHHWRHLPPRAVCERLLPGQC